MARKKDEISTLMPDELENANGDICEKPVLQSTATEAAKTEPEKYVYMGQSLPGGALKANAVFCGSFEKVCGYLSEEIEKFPQVKGLLVPFERIADFEGSNKVMRLRSELEKAFKNQ